MRKSNLWYGAFSFLFFSLFVPAYTYAESQLEITFADLPVELQLVTLCESKAKQEARGPYGEIGMLQIHPKYHLARAKSLGYDLYSPNGNMAYGFLLYTENGLAPWKSSRGCWLKQLSYIQSFAPLSF